MTKKMPKIPRSQEIFVLNAGDSENYDGVWGYFTEGHWDAQNFAVDCNLEFDLSAAHSAIVYTNEVRHAYISAMPPIEGDHFLIHKLPARGCEIPITYVCLV